MAHSVVIANPPSGILSLSEAVQGCGPNETTIYLYPSSCSSADDTGRVFDNCTIACQDPKMVWDNMQTLHNCLAYFTISHHLSVDGTLDATSVELASAFGFLPHAQTRDLDDAILDAVQVCMRSYCEETANEQRCRTREFRTPQQLIQGACGSFKASPNLDIGGVGVYIGYVMQLGILAYAYVHTRMVSHWTYGIALSTFVFGGRGRARERAQRVQARLDGSHQQAALLSSLVEFQKAQSYFAITLQASAIGALAGDGVMFEADSLQQMHLTLYLLGDVAATSIVCVVSGLYLLHAEGKRHGYTTLLSIMAFVLSLIVWIQTRLPLLNLRKLAVRLHDLPQCGYRSPATYCPGKSVRETTHFEAATIIICSLTLLSLLLLQRTRLGELRFNTLYFRHWVPEAIEAVHAGLAVTMLVQMATNGEIDAVTTGAVEWSFAQLISVTIWAPVIVEYIYAAWRGVQAMQQHRVFSADDD